VFVPVTVPVETPQVETADVNVTQFVENPTTVIERRVSVPVAVTATPRFTG
jgi:hypothetical protein